MRDENGFKCHTQSEAHVRQMLLVGESPQKFIKAYSDQFQRDFLQLLRTSHGEKAVGINWFYQSYIGNKEHVHMNSTKWKSLTEFAKSVGREGLCRVAEDPEKGLTIAWIDNSPEKLRRQEANRKKERQDRGDEEHQMKLIKEQVARAQSMKAAALERDEIEVDQGLQRNEGEKITLNFGSKKADILDSDQQKKVENSSSGDDRDDQSASPPAGETASISSASPIAENATPTAEQVVTQSKPVSISTIKIGGPVAPKNVFAAAKKKSTNPLSSSGKSQSTKPTFGAAPSKPRSEAERIMREELERKRRRDEWQGSRGGDSKRVRV
jgi:DNA/RNA-binding protein KIN17